MFNLKVLFVIGLCLSFVHCRAQRRPINLEEMGSRYYKDKGGDFSPRSSVIILILQGYCQMLIEQGVTNLPYYCYSARAFVSEVDNILEKVQHETLCERRRNVFGELRSRSPAR